jgi:hypothetical protein
VAGTGVVVGVPAGPTPVTAEPDVLADVALTVLVDTAVDVVAEPEACVLRAAVLPPVAAVAFVLALLVGAVRASGVGVFPPVADVVAVPASVAARVALGSALASGVGVAGGVAAALGAACVGWIRAALVVGVADAPGVAVALLALPPQAASAAMTSNMTSAGRRERTDDIRRTLLRSRQGEASPPPMLAP